MSQIPFFKFQGSGNDFIFFDLRNPIEEFSSETVQFLCDRKKGIGADGVIFLKNSCTADFKMQIFNADGKEAKSCGNGLFCFYQFLLFLGLEKRVYQIELCQEKVTLSSKNDRMILHMNPPTKISLQKKVSIQNQKYIVHYIHSGAPHLVVFVEDINNYPVAIMGKRFRNLYSFSPEGVNVNFVEVKNSKEVFVRVYEKGVEAETLACGTGASAVGIAAHFIKNLAQEINVHFPGGMIGVSFAAKNPSEIVELKILGSAHFVYKGFIEIYKRERILC